MTKFVKVDCLPNELCFQKGYAKGKSFDFIFDESEKIDMSHLGRVLYNDLTETKILNLQDYLLFDFSYVCEVWFLEGVTDNSSHVLQEALEILSLKAQAKSSRLYFFEEKTRGQIVDLIESEIMNPLIEGYKLYSKEEFLRSERFSTQRKNETYKENDHFYDCFDLSISERELEELSQSRCLALNSHEMTNLKRFSKSQTFLESRKKFNLPDKLTDVELEVFAQTWSEHCKHKIFSSYIEYSEEILDVNLKRLGSFDVDSLYKATIKGSTKEIEKKRGLGWLVSVFEDNAGIVRFFEEIDVCIKVETHNSPSALDPYGGALTGILGVNRDILGTGLGAKPIGNTNVFCVGPYEWNAQNTNGLLPANLLTPRKLLKGVHRGVQDGGNKSGIPTINGAMLFDQDYCGKPLVFCGTVGILPPKLKDGRETAKKTPFPGDMIIIVGGGVGADGIHGATFSSLELNESSPRSAVQIGDPLTQKRVLDFTLEARDEGLINCITDNGAGGISSSVGEMASLVGGAKIHLDAHPTKYPGLKPWEIMISESQERMTLAVEPKKRERIFKLASKHGVQISEIGEFNKSGFLEIFYKDKHVGALDLDYLHNGLEQMKLKAVWDGPRLRKNWAGKVKKTFKYNPEGFQEACLNLLNHPNIASKDYWIKQYDHEVGGRSVLKPLEGKKRLSPSNSSILSLKEYSQNKRAALAVSCGLSPLMSQYDPYLMAIYAVDEAVRNIISVGGDIETLCLLDNFCWPDPVLSKNNPDGDYKLGQLVRCCMGLKDICLAYGTPLVSGKDSMKNDYRGKNYNDEEVKISIQPTLLVTALAKADNEKYLTSHFQDEKDLIYLIEGSKRSLSASLFSEIYDNEEESLELSQPRLDKNFSVYKEVNGLIRKSLIESCHDISEGGLICALFESCFENNLSFDVSIKEPNCLAELFGEGTGGFLVSVKEDNKEAFLKSLSEVSVRLLGRVNSEDKSLIRIKDFTFHVPIKNAKGAWLYNWDKQDA